MSRAKYFCVFALSAALLAAVPGPAAQIEVQGSPAEPGFNVGGAAVFRATLKGVEGDPSRYAVFAEIQYLGTTASSNTQLDRVGEPKDGEVHYEGGWLIPSDAPTGIYSARIRVEDRKEHRAVATQKLRSFAAYRKLLSIRDVRLDKSYYTQGDPIQCEVAIENLTNHPLSGLRVEFSNANYPWISSFAEKEHPNPALGLKVLSSGLNLAPYGITTIPMTPAGTARFLQGQMVEMLGAGGPARNASQPPPEVDQYTVAVWNAERTVLYDMQFSQPALVRAWDRDLPKPYSNLAYTHPYNSEIDFSKYREFYPPGQISAAIRLDTSHTLFRPGDALKVRATLENPGAQAWNGVELRAQISDADGKELHQSALRSGLMLEKGKPQTVEADAWQISQTLAPGNYRLRLKLVNSGGTELAAASTDIAVNKLPASILVVAPHEDDEHAYAGLIRAGIEAGIPVHVVIMTSGDVGACERYYSRPCGPNEAREFAEVRMEESAEALEHLGLDRKNLSILGLPDGGSGEIWFHHIKASNSLLSVYLATDHAPFENVVKPNLAFARDEVIDQLKQMIADFRTATPTSHTPCGFPSGGDRNGASRRAACGPSRDQLAGRESVPGAASRQQNGSSNRCARRSGLRRGRLQRGALQVRARAGVSLG